MFYKFCTTGLDHLVLNFFATLSFVSELKIAAFNL